MGAKYSGVKERVIAQRNQRLQNEMVHIRSSLDELGLTVEGCKKIGGMTVVEIVQNLNQGILSSKELITALGFRSGTFGIQWGLVTETNFNEALRIAEQCDKKRKESKKKNWTFSSGEQFNCQKFLPPLFGIPISIKDVFDMKGFMTTVGCVSKTNVQDQDCPLVTCLRGSGMIPFVRSTCPQMALTFEDHSHLWGRGRNPWNPERTVGGSSGGEGGLISGRCSLIGLGSDIGGSIRIPAQFCGIFGIKPSSRRISSLSHTHLSLNLQSFEKSVPLNVGPLAHSVQDLALFMKVATDIDNYHGTADFYTKIVPFNSKQYNQQKLSLKKYRIGYFRSLQCSEPTKSTLRALDTILDELRAQGHELIEIKIPNEKQMIHSFFKDAFSVSCRNFYEVLDGEKQVPEYKALFMQGSLKQPLRGIVGLIAKKFMPRIHEYFIKDVGPMSTLEYQEQVGKMSRYRQEWMKYWKENELDYVVSPGFGCQALKHGMTANVTLPMAYTMIWNVLDMTVGSMPVTTVLPEEQDYQTRFSDPCATDLIQNAKGSVGLPVGVQFVGAPYKEEKVLGFMHRIAEKINFYQKHPLPM